MSRNIDRDRPKNLTGLYLGGGPYVVGPYLSGPNNEHNVLQRPI